MTAPPGVQPAPMHEHPAHAAASSLSGAATRFTGGIFAARELVAAAKQVQFLAVLGVLADGATWAEVAAQTGLTVAAARAVYGPVWDRWRGGDPEPWLPPGCAARFDERLVD